MLTGLYALVPEEQLKSVLETFQAFTELPLRLIDPDGNTLYHFGGSTAYCALLKTHLFRQNECDHIHMKAGQRASALGEAYIFTQLLGIDSFSCLGVENKIMFHIRPPLFYIKHNYNI